MKKVDRIKAAMDAYRAEWDLTHPAPRKEKVRAMDFLQFYLFLPVALLGPLVSAFRTAALLMETAAFQDSPLFVALEALLGTVFFELGAIVYQIIRLRRRAQEEGGMPKIGTGWIIFGMIITIGAVTTSNFVEVLIAALEKANANFIPPSLTALLIGIFVGPGVAACTVIAGEVVGRFLLEWQAANAILVEKYENVLAEHEGSFLRSWNSKKGKDFLAAWTPDEGVTTVVPDRPRSEYSKWADRDARGRQDQIVRYVKDHDPNHSGVPISEIWEAVWNGRKGSDSARYDDIKKLEGEGRLEIFYNGKERMVRLASRGAAF